MVSAGNIVIGDASAFHFLMHCDAALLIAKSVKRCNPLDGCACGSKALMAFNPDNPLYGGKPVSLLVPHAGLRRVNSNISCKVSGGSFPPGSFFQLREGLYALTPEALFLRAAGHLPLIALVALGIDLCGRYFLRIPDEKICDRSAFTTTPERIGDYINAASTLHGCKKARHALQFIVGNSGSPAETKIWVQYCMPLRYGGFGLPFTHMNYDVSAGRLAGLIEQTDFCIDMVRIDPPLGMEYDGRDYHQDASKDKRRRNELKVLGWDVYPIDSSILYNADETIRSGRQLAKLMGKRLRLDACWRERFIELRQAIDLPISWRFLSGRLL